MASTDDPIRPEGGVCPGVAQLLLGNGSTATEDTSRSAAAPSPTVSSSTLFFERLRLEATALKQKKGRVVKNHQGRN
jgi:hypothetical protein